MERRHMNEPFELTSKPRGYPIYDSAQPALIDTITTEDGVAGYIVTQDEIESVMFYSMVGPDQPASYALKLEMFKLLRECHRGGMNYDQAKSALRKHAGFDRWATSVWAEDPDSVTGNRII